MTCQIFVFWVACEPAPRGGKRKDRLQLRLLNLNICIEKVDAKCWLVEMTLVMTSLPLAHAFQCLFTFALVSASCWLAEIWQLSWQGATGKLEAKFKFQRRSCNLSFLFPPCCQSAPESLLTGYILCSLREVWLIGKPVLTFKMISGGMQWVSSSYSLLLISINLNT